MSLALAVAVAGCAPDTAYRAPWYPFSDHFVGHVSGAPVLARNPAWWRALREPALDRLIEMALAGSPSLELARERVTEAKANLGTIGGGASLDPSLRVLHQRTAAGSKANVGEATLAFDWLLDPWGGRKAQKAGARARIEVADAEVDSARLLLIYNVANAYIDLRFQQNLLAVRQQELTGRRRTLGLVRRLFESDNVTRLEMVAAQARLAETEATLPGLEASILTQKYRLAVLTGRAPGTLDLDLDRRARQPVPAMAPDIGIPADLIRNRPDLRIAERLYYAAVSDTGAARANLYPRLSLGGAITVSALDATGTEYYFGPTLQLPALPGSPRRAVLEARDSQARQAMTSWKSTVLDALLEVENALASYAGASRSVGAARKSVTLYREAIELTRELVTGQGATLRDLVDAEVAVTDAELALASNLRQFALAFVALNTALGSGASPDEVPAASAPGG